MHSVKSDRRSIAKCSPLYRVEDEGEGGKGRAVREGRGGWEGSERRRGRKRRREDMEFQNG